MTVTVTIPSPPPLTLALVANLSVDSTDMHISLNGQLNYTYLNGHVQYIPVYSPRLLPVLLSVSHVVCAPSPSSLGHVQYPAYNLSIV